eukprot:Skav205883  [mRNA]  locus=scaffold766:343127:358207:+ [translate_table: standard]
MRVIGDLLVFAWIRVCCCIPVDESLQAWLDFKENNEKFKEKDEKENANEKFAENANENFDSKFEDLGNRRPWAQDVPRVRALNLELYRDFEGRMPVVWEGAYGNFPCLKNPKWVEKKLMSAEGILNEKVVFLAKKAKENDERVMSTKMKIFLKNVNQNSPLVWSYLQDEFFLRRHPDLMASCPPLPPLLQKQDQFALLPPKFIPPNATLLWGGRYSRSKLHVDPYNWTGTNVVIRGEKFFRLIPPGADHLLNVKRRSCHMALECVSYESSTDLFEATPQGVPLWETKLQQGDLLIIPSGWWHQAVNLGTTLAIAWQRARKNSEFFKVLIQLHVLLGIVAWFAALVVMLLVGTLAWDCCGVFEDCEADDAFSCRSWDRTRTPDASPDELVGGQFELHSSSYFLFLLLISFFLPFSSCTLGARDFLARLLEEPEHRLSAVEALEHPWLNASWHGLRQCSGFQFVHLKKGSLNRNRK